MPTAAALFSRRSSQASVSLFSRKSTTSSRFNELYALIQSRLYATGKATEQGTKSFCQQRYPLIESAEGFVGGHTISTRQQKWTISPIGFGSYRVGTEDKEHQYALQMAIQAGCNIIDTSTNYESGDSEIMIGNVVNGMIGEGLVNRDELVVVTKVGYLQGRNLEQAELRAADQDQDLEQYYPEMVKVDPAGQHYHCLSPKFIDEQLRESLQRLDLDCVDVLLLHNPEYCWQKGETADSFYRKIEAAFRYLESEVARGRIQRYGISSNTFATPKAFNHVSLERCLSIARSICGDSNHFDFIEFPFNILEHDAYSTGLIDLAHKNGVCCLGNRPLNAGERAQNKMYRFADFDLNAAEANETDKQLLSRLQQLLDDAMFCELRFPDKRYRDAPGVADPLLPTKRSLHWTHIIIANIDQFDTLSVWQSLLQHQIRPEIDEALQQLRAHPSFQTLFKDWSGQYRYITNQLFATYTQFLEHKQSSESARARQKLDSISPALRFSGTLSQKAVRTLCSSGIDCVLVGMRTLPYVRDIMLNLGGRLPKEEVDKIFREFKWQPLRMLRGDALEEGTSQASAQGEQQQQKQESGQGESDAQFVEKKD